MTIIHGTSDSIIPPHHSEKLLLSVEHAEKERILIKNAGHNDIYSFDQTNKALSNALEYS